jgi:hypothetical protein
MIIPLATATLAAAISGTPSGSSAQVAATAPVTVSVSQLPAKTHRPASEPPGVALDRGYLARFVQNLPLSGDGGG